MKNLTPIFLTSLILMIFIFSGCKTSKIAGSAYIGDWHYTFPTQDGGTMNAIMHISMEEDLFKGQLSSELGSVDLDELPMNATRKQD